MRKMMEKLFTKCFLKTHSNFAPQVIQLMNISFVHGESPHELDNDKSLSCESKEKSPLDKRPWTASGKWKNRGFWRSWSLTSEIHFLCRYRKFGHEKILSLMTCLEACPKFPLKGSFASDIHLRKLQSFDATERLARAVLLRRGGRPGSGSSGCARRSRERNDL